MRFSHWIYRIGRKESTGECEEAGGVGSGKDDGATTSADPDEGRPTHAGGWAPPPSPPRSLFPIRMFPACIGVSLPFLYAYASFRYCLHEANQAADWSPMAKKDKN
ncbi:hypothetical protein NL676_039229 [Syzygium grande]|nr:hypothetical protein NL676_039229 [Syzygium grande]